MKKKLVIIIIVVLCLLGLIIGSNKYKSSDIAKNDDVWYNLGDLRYYLYQGNEVNFNDNNLISKNVQNAINELYDASSSGCFVGYTKGTETLSQYTCNKASAESFSDLLYAAADVIYDNTSSGLNASNLQDAIIEIAQYVPYCKTNYEKQNETSNSYDCVRTTFTSMLSVTNNSVSLSYGTNGSNSYSYNGDGTVSCQSSDTSKVTCSVDSSNNTVSLVPVGITTSDVTITLSATAGALYMAPNDAIFTVSVGQRTVTVTAPVAASGTITYNGSSQTIFSSAGSCSAGGTMYWYGAPTKTSTAPSFSTSTWTTTAPSRKATNAGTWYYYYYCRVTDTVNNTGTNINTVKSVSKAIAKKATTMSISPTSISPTCLNTKTITVTTDGDGTISCSSSATAKATCSVSGKTVTVTGKESGSATITISQAAGTNYKAATSKTATATVTCYVWKATYSNYQSCLNNCDTYSQCRDNGKKCTDSKTSQPTSSSNTGGQCWCKQ